MKSSRCSAYLGVCSLGPVNTYDVIVRSSSVLADVMRSMNSSPKKIAFASETFEHMAMRSSVNLKFRGTAFAPVLSMPK